MKKIFALALSALALSSAPAAWADANIEASPAGWRMQNYAPNTLLVHFTGSPCQYGTLSFPANATNEDRNRFYALVLSAATTGKKVGVYYETVSGSCQITSFYTP
jgi:hypothetical protein